MCSDVFLGANTRIEEPYFLQPRVSLFRHSQEYFLGVANKLCFTVGKCSIYFCEGTPFRAFMIFTFFSSVWVGGPMYFHQSIVIFTEEFQRVLEAELFFSKVRAEDFFVAFFWMEIHGNWRKNMKKTQGFAWFSLMLSVVFVFVPNGMNSDCDEYN